VVPAERAVPLPGDAPDELGACLGVPAVTAAHCLLVRGHGGREALRERTVLVAGGAGAVGHYAIELAKHAGARVVTTVSSEEKAELARAAGADLVVNYREDGAIDRVREFADRVDRVVEVALGANLELDLTVAGALSPLPVTRYGLDDVVAAHEAVENGAVGKVLVVP
jgi:NADPH2:quinone reductase